MAEQVAYDRDLGRITMSETESGIKVKVLYTLEDIAHIDYSRDIGSPAEEPYTRGIYPEMYRARRWLDAFVVCYTTAKETNEAFKKCIAGGLTGLRFVTDTPSASGLDPDHPLAKQKYALGDINTTLIRTHNGCTVTLYHDTQSPRPYNLIFRVQGTEGIYSGTLNKIYIHNTSGSEVLVKVIPANLYDANGTIGAAITSCRFITNPAVRDATIDQLNAAGLVAPLTLIGSAPVGMAADRPLIATGGIPPEYVFFWDLDEFQGMGKFAYTNSAGSRFNGLITLEPLAKTDDNLPFLVKTYGSMIDSWEATSYVSRGLRVA